MIKEKLCISHEILGYTELILYSNCYNSEIMRVEIKKFKELCDYFGHIISDKLPELIRKRIKKHPQVESVVLKDRGHYTMAAVYQLSTN